MSTSTCSRRCRARTRRPRAPRTSTTPPRTRPGHRRSRSRSTSESLVDSLHARAQIVARGVLHRRAVCREQVLPIELDEAAELGPEALAVLRLARAAPAGADARAALE